MRLPTRGAAHRTDRRLELGGVCGHREVGRVTPAPRGEAWWPDTHLAQDKKWPSWMKPGTPWRTPRPGARDAKALTKPGGAAVHPCPRQYVIQPMLRRYGPFRTSAARASDPRSNRHQPRCTAAHCTPATSATTISKSRAARSGIAIKHRNRTKIQSATRSTSRIRWFLRSNPEPVEYSQYTMPRHSSRIA